MPSQSILLVSVVESLRVFKAIFDSTFSLMCLVGSLRLFKAALKGVLSSPVSFFDTTPMGQLLPVASTAFHLKYLILRTDTIKTLERSRHS